MQLLKTHILLFSILLSFSVFSQNKITDSLRLRIKTSKADTNKVNSLNLLSDYLLARAQYDSAFQLATEAGKLAEKLKYPKGISFSMYYLGMVYKEKGDHTVALEYFKKYLETSLKLPDKNEIAGAYNSIGNVYRSTADYPRALENYLSALKKYEESGNKRGIANIYSNIGTTYWNQKDNDAALDYYSKALKIQTSTLPKGKPVGSKMGISNTLSNIGNIYYEKEKFNEALDYYQRSLLIKEEIQDIKGIATAYNNIGNVQLEQHDTLKALEDFLKGLKLREEIGNKSGIAHSCNNLAGLYGALKKYPEALVYGNKGLQMARETGTLDAAERLEETMSAIYEKKGDFKKALAFYKEFIASRDSIFNEENTKKTVQAQMNYEFDKKEAVAKAEQEKKEAVAAAESRKQKIIMGSVCGILLLVLVFAVFAYRSFLQKKKANEEITQQKHLIEEKQKEILDSIYYARRIQRSLLTSTTYIERNLTKLKAKI